MKNKFKKGLVTCMLGACLLGGYSNNSSAKEYTINKYENKGVLETKIGSYQGSDERQTSADSDSKGYLESAYEWLTEKTSPEEAFFQVPFGGPYPHPRWLSITSTFAYGGVGLYAMYLLVKDRIKKGEDKK